MMEVAISDSVMAFQHELLWRGPGRIRTCTTDDLVIVRSFGVLTPAERRISEASEGRKTVKGMRRQSLEVGRETLEEVVEERTGARVLSVHSDLSTHHDEWMIVLVLDRVFGEGS